ncbi:hypothetical protein BJ138DRAFT_1167331 [Hygrophoropsis aurantiaca]|uniref:Uncharacterized protein n=1 Tax=Hygrophoropsis aurantiaca TaxID=72124 RepID=A0ACB7ZTC7_9AGAM|nr:hypothetical protein BJ138DRAFT_1167331 [Hygrophoropsis aurantiaca]
MATKSATAPTDVAHALQAQLEGANLQILDARLKLGAYKFDDDDLGGGDDTGTSKDPEGVRNDVAAQVSFLRRLKFQYLEQNAKDKYIKTIVSDDAPLVTAAANEALRLRNEEKKAALREAKAKLEEKKGDVKVLAGLVEEDYSRAKTLTQEATTLSQKILDARLELTRLRQAHPHPRLTVKSATATLEAQEAEMQDLDEAMRGVTEEIGQIKEGVRKGVGEIERLRAEKVELEKIAGAARVGEGEGEEDGRVAGLYDWFSASLTLHRSLLSLVSSHAETENELRLRYAVGQGEITIKLLFIPNTRQLGAAEVIGPDGGMMDVGDVLDTHVHANDVSGLVWAVLARARNGGGT